MCFGQLRVWFGIIFWFPPSSCAPTPFSAHCGSGGVSAAAIDIMQSGTSAGSGHDHHLKKTSDSERRDFPELTSERPLAHAAEQYIEQAESRFAALGLLAAAEGHPHASTLAIVDIDLDELPPLPRDHRDYERRMETRTKTKAHNRSNAQKRATIQMDAWTQIYALLEKSTERYAPVLSRQLKALCDLEKIHGIPGGYFDGPRALGELVLLAAMSHSHSASATILKTGAMLRSSEVLCTLIHEFEYSTTRACTEGVATRCRHIVLCVA
jgi:ribosomal protein L18E